MLVVGFSAAAAAGCSQSVTVCLRDNTAISKPRHESAAAISGDAEREGQERRGATGAAGDQVWAGLPPGTRHLSSGQQHPQTAPSRSPGKIRLHGNGHFYQLVKGRDADVGVTGRPGRRRRRPVSALPALRAAHRKIQ